MTYDNTLNRIDISNIETIGTYTRMFSRSIRTSPGRCPNHPSHPRIATSPTTMKIRPSATMSWPSGLLPTLNSYRRYSSLPPHACARGNSSQTTGTSCGGAVERRAMRSRQSKSAYRNNATGTRICPSANSNNQRMRSKRSE